MIKPINNASVFSGRPGHCAGRTPQIKLGYRTYRADGASILSFRQFLAVEIASEKANRNPTNCRGVFVDVIR